MKPRIPIEQTTTFTRLPLDLVEHDGRYTLESGGTLVAAQNWENPAIELMEMICQPFRPAKQPRLIFLGLGFGHAIKAARHFLPQEKASFVIFPEAEVLPNWIEKHLPESPIDDGHNRVHLETLSPFRPIPAEYAKSQAVIMDHDHLLALSPGSYDPTHPTSLHNIYDSLKVGGLLGIIGSRLDNALKKRLQKCGFEVAHEFVPLSEKSKKNRTIYLARKGHYRGNR
ncbi:MAG: hypothetical protein ACON4K_00975 [Akkermansiaceae bacterium]